MTDFIWYFAGAAYSKSLFSPEDESLPHAMICDPHQHEIVEHARTEEHGPEKTRDYHKAILRAVYSRLERSMLAKDCPFEIIKLLILQNPGTFGYLVSL